MDPAIRDLFYELFVIIKDAESGEKQLDLGVKIALEIKNKLKNDPQYATQHLPDLEAAKQRVGLKVIMEERVKEIKQTMAEALNQRLAAATWNGTGGEDMDENKASGYAGTKRKQTSVDEMDDALKELGLLKKKLKRDTQPPPEEEVADVKIEQKSSDDANNLRQQSIHRNTPEPGTKSNSTVPTTSNTDRSFVWYRRGRSSLARSRLRHSMDLPSKNP